MAGEDGAEGGAEDGKFHRRRNGSFAERAIPQALQFPDHLSVSTDHRGQLEVAVSTLGFLNEEVQRIADPKSGRPVIISRDELGGQFISADISSAAGSARWLHASVSPLALTCWLRGRADLADLFLHSMTGHVELITVDGTNVAGRVVLCDDLPANVFSETTRALSLVA